MLLFRLPKHNISDILVEVLLYSFSDKMIGIVGDIRTSLSEVKF